MTRYQIELVKCKMRIFQDAMDKHGGVIRHACRYLGVNSDTYNYTVHKYREALKKESTLKELESINKTVEV